MTSEDIHVVLSAADPLSVKFIFMQFLAKFFPNIRQAPLPLGGGAAIWDILDTPLTLIPLTGHLIYSKRIQGRSGAPLCTPHSTYQSFLDCLEFSGFATARKRSFGQGNIFSSMCQEFCTQGGDLGRYTPWAVPPGRYPRAGTPPGQVHTL